MSNEIIKRFIHQRCIGYSQDYKTSWFECEVEMQDGSTRQCWTSSRETQSGLYESGPVAWKLPFVSRTIMVNQ